NPYAYVVAAFQALPSPDYVPGPEYPLSPEFVQSRYTQSYIGESDPNEDPEEDPVDYPADGGDKDDDEDESSDDHEDDDIDIKEDEEEDEWMMILILRGEIVPELDSFDKRSFNVDLFDEKLHPDLAFLCGF
nr:hypothetical protein [Tanacetum cinerariifolium]